MMHGQKKTSSNAQKVYPETWR